VSESLHCISLVSINVREFDRFESLLEQYIQEMPLSAAEKLEKKKRLEEKREARRLAKEKKEKAASGAAKNSNSTEKKDTQAPEKKGKCYIFELSDDTLNHVLWYASARELGALTLTCRHFSAMLRGSRPAILMSRLHRPNEKITGAVGWIDMCADRTEAR
jgi:hypothetical protein